MYPNTYRIKALQQGADSSLDDKITYEGDSSVVVDREKINIQIHCITPGYKGKHIQVYKSDVSDVLLLDWFAL